MGVEKTADGRSLVGIGVADANNYKGFLSWRDIVIQLTSNGATAESVDRLNALRDYAIFHSGDGSPIKPPDVNVWISANGYMKAVEADDFAVTGSGDSAQFECGGIKWTGSAWDYTNAGQSSGGGGGSSGGSVLVVNVITTTDGETTILTCDKTAAEMYEAAENGLVVLHQITADDTIVSFCDNYTIYQSVYYFQAGGNQFSAFGPTDYPSTSGGK